MQPTGPLTDKPVIHVTTHAIRHSQNHDGRLTDFIWAVIHATAWVSWQAAK